MDAIMAKIRKNPFRTSPKNRAGGEKMDGVLNISLVCSLKSIYYRPRVREDISTGRG